MSAHDSFFLFSVSCDLHIRHYHLQMAKKSRCNYTCKILAAATSRAPDFLGFLSGFLGFLAFSVWSMGVNFR
jgi:hypothetical protein